MRLHSSVALIGGLLALPPCLALLDADSATSSDECSIAYGQCDDPSRLAGVVASNPDELRLSPTWDIYAAPQVREYYFTVEEIPGAPDGFERNMLVVNRQFPGPLIEANQGDTLVVHVQNLISQPLTIHWHGLAQNGTNPQDGPSGVTQCPIPAGMSYTYRFTVFRNTPVGQYGTYWWHAHRRSLYADGITGPLVIHAPEDPLKLGEDYDIDQIVVINDWYHTESTVIVDALQTPEGFQGTFKAPSPQSGLINGRGQWNCSFATVLDTCNELPPLVFTFPPDQRIRLRFIHVGQHPVFFLSVDEHELTVIEADDTPVEEQPVHRIPINVAQRYSAVLDTTGHSIGDSFYLRADINTVCLGASFTDMTVQNLAIIRIANNDDEPVPTGLPESRDWLDPIVGNCTDLDESLLVPRIAVHPPAESNQLSIFNTTAVNTTEDVFQWTVDAVTFENFANDPILHKVARGEPIGRKVSATIVAEREEVLDIVIQNVQGAPHPFHLHGIEMSLIARGTGLLGPGDAPDVPYNLDNPLRRDTISVLPGAWVVVRLVADLAGVHAFHCHIGWHLSQGLMGVLVVEPEVLRTLGIPAANLELCNNAERNQIDPGRKRLV
ncbi:hypothetical protein JCM21900_003585 [Sporobolomyces salmonicolor]